MLTTTSAVVGAQAPNQSGGINFFCLDAQLAPTASCYSYTSQKEDSWALSPLVGPLSTSKLSLNLWYAYSLTSAPLASFNVFLNGSTVGNFALGGPATDMAYATFDFFFAPVVANSFDLQILWAGAPAPPGGGSVDFYTTDYAPYERFSDISLEVSAVPEPATLALFAPGLLAVGMIAWRRKQTRA